MKIQYANKGNEGCMLLSYSKGHMGFLGTQEGNGNRKHIINFLDQFNLV